MLTESPPVKPILPFLFQLSSGIVRLGPGLNVPTGERLSVRCRRKQGHAGCETWLGANMVQEDASVILTKQLLEMLKELKEI